MKKLFVDTSRSDITKVSLSIDGKIIELSRPTDKEKSQVVLELIDSVLKKANIKLSDITEVSVVTGPGSFTGLRVGLSVVNTLSNFLNIPINSKKPGTIVDASYT